MASTSRSRTGSCPSRDGSRSREGLSPGQEAGGVGLRTTPPGGGARLRTTLGGVAGLDPALNDHRRRQTRGNTWSGPTGYSRSTPGMCWRNTTWWRTLLQDTLLVKYGQATSTTNAAERSRYSSSDSSGEEGDHGQGQLLWRVLGLDLGAIIWGDQGPVSLPRHRDSSYTRRDGDSSRSRRHRGVSVQEREVLPAQRVERPSAHNLLYLPHSEVRPNLACENTNRVPQAAQYCF